MPDPHSESLRIRRAGLPLRTLLCAALASGVAAPAARAESKAVLNRLVKKGLLTQQEADEIVAEEAAEKAGASASGETAGKPAPTTGTDAPAAPSPTVGGGRVASGTEDRPRVGTDAGGMKKDQKWYDRIRIDGYAQRPTATSETRTGSPVSSGSTSETSPGAFPKPEASNKADAPCAAARLRHLRAEAGTSAGRLRQFRLRHRHSLPDDGVVETDVLIVGAGLAGTLLALELEKRGRDVVVIDDGLRDAASAVATGLITPVTGMRFAVTPDAATLIPEALRVFRETSPESVREMSLFRGYENAGEIALVAKRRLEPETARRFGDDIAPERVHPSLAAPLGGVMIEGVVRIDLPAFLRTTRARLGRRLRDEPFVHAELAILPGDAGVRYRDIAARRIVFAEGAAVTSNPWFAGPVWKPAKGEFVTCDCGDFPMPDFALKLGLSAVPLGSGRWRVGSNYDWKNLDCRPTPEIRETLVSGFRKMFRHAPDFAVTDHGAGVRPAAEGAKPVVRAHPDFPALVVFNGFGAKGCTRIPYHARRLAAMLP